MSVIIRRGRRLPSVGRYYTTPVHTTPKRQPPAKPSPAPRSPPSAHPQTRHEVHEGTSAINMPYNPPGGGPAGAAGFTFTNSPVLDAILTTAIGLGAGKFNPLRSTAQNNSYQPSFRRGHRIFIMVQEKRFGQGMSASCLLFSLDIIAFLRNR